MTGEKTDKSINRNSRDVTTDESISILDPRRFTPSLHANLVSEILALRRDQEEKLKIIESLESSLHSSKQEEESLKSNLATTAKESRSVKRQLALLEGGTSSALRELAKERDEAVDTAAESKKRIEVLQKKIRSQEDDSQRVHDQWAREKDLWTGERRKYERQVHVAESRLKVVLDEVAAYQAAQQQTQGGEMEEKEDDAASVRTMSMTNSIQFSTANGHSSLKPVNGNSLADELNLDGDEDWQTDNDGRESVLSNHLHMRNASRESNFSRSHFRNQSVESLVRPGSVARGRFYVHSALERLEGGIREDEETQCTTTISKASYVNSGIQYSPPPSPSQHRPSKSFSPEPPTPVSRLEHPYGVESPPREWEVEANQRKKRVHMSRPSQIEPPPVISQLMVSSASQTMEIEPLSPPNTPKSHPIPQSPARPPSSSPHSVIEPPKRILKNSATQTYRAPTPPPPPPPPPPPGPVLMPPVPSISVFPPTSRPTTPREPRLPQLSKDFGCQVAIQVPAMYTTSSVQTDEIRIDQRLKLLPPHLHPSAVTSRPHSPEPAAVQEAEDIRQSTPTTFGNLPPRNPRRLMSRNDVTTEIPSSPKSPEPVATNDAYPGNNDNGPLSNKQAPMRRPHRTSSLFAGFDGNSSEEVDEFGDVEASDPEFRTALSAPRPNLVSEKTTKRSSIGIKKSSPQKYSYRKHVSTRTSMKYGGTELYSRFSLVERNGSEPVNRRPSLKSSRALDKSVTGSNRASVMRKAAMIQSGIASHQGRARSPSLQYTRDPPFPIPTRASSKRPPMSASAPSDGQRSPTPRFFREAWHRRGTARSGYRTHSIRKVRSAAALPRNQRYRRHDSCSPPPFSSSVESPESPGIPPLPNNDITTPRGREVGNGSRYKMHRHQNSTNTANTGDTGVGSVGSSAQATGVVDAIAQAMVGEWMFKYVRRRKSFGVSESSAKDESGNDRHKRWVWLAPYERAILWSSKQPASGSALLGKTGRKLTIQSVLDVKDDNPWPRGAPQLFNRSILILTPQRALKFTTTSAERHYTWLTSLSFLAHSSQAVPELIQHPKPLPEFEPPKPKVRRPGIRDSIRLAKAKTSLARMGQRPASPPPQLPDLNGHHQPDPFIPPIPPPTHMRDPSYEVAEAPYIPRFHERANQLPTHGRKRSNTGGHVPPPLSFRGFSGAAGGGGGGCVGTYHTSTSSTAGASIGTAGSSDIYQSQPSTNGTMWPMSTTASGRTSEASSRRGNFFDAIGTVRMEAFIGPLAFTRVDNYPDEHEELRRLARRRSKEMRRHKSPGRQRDSYQSRGTRTTDEGGYPGSEDFFRDDPFKGF